MSGKRQLSSQNGDFCPNYEKSPKIAAVISKRIEFVRSRGASKAGLTERAIDYWLVIGRCRSSWSVARLKARALACMHHLSIRRLGAGTRASAVASGFGLVFRTLIHPGLGDVLFLLGLGLRSRQELNGPAVMIILRGYAHETCIYQ